MNMYVEISISVINSIITIRPFFYRTYKEFRRLQFSCNNFRTPLCFWCKKCNFVFEISCLIWKTFYKIEMMIQRILSCKKKLTIVFVLCWSNRWSLLCWFEFVCLKIVRWWNFGKCSWYLPNVVCERDCEKNQYFSSTTYLRNSRKAL